MSIRTKALLMCAMAGICGGFGWHGIAIQFDNPSVIASACWGVASAMLTGAFVCLHDITGKD